MDAVTLGMWFWDPPPDSQDGDYAIVLIDTEGMYSPNIPATYDAKIFALSLILSSTLIYNGSGVLKQQSVDRFQYLTRITLNFLEKIGTDRASCWSESLLRERERMVALV